MSETGKRFYRPELDAVRFLAFLLVFFHHSLPRNTGLHGRLYESVADALGFGLCLFFTLSAYLITLLLLREREQTGSIHFRAFYIRRALRIWPLYFLGLGLNLVVTYFMADHWDTGSVLKNLALGLIMLGNFVSPVGSAHLVIDALWSISLEEQFYLFWPSTMRWLRPRLFVWGAVCILIAANLTLIHFGRIHADADFRVWSNSLVQFEMFGAGILLALFDGKRPIFSPVSSTALVVTAALLWFVAAFHFGIKGNAGFQPGPLDFTVGYSLVAIGCVLILVAVPGFRRWPKPIIYLGKISFGLYVFHSPVLILTRKYIGDRIPHGLALVCLTFTIVCAAVSYRFFETPFLLRKRSHELVPSRPL